MSDTVRPHRRQPTRLPLPWDSPGKITGVGCHFLLQCMKVEGESRKSLGRVRLSATPWTAAHQAPPSMGFSRQEYWSGVPLPSPGIPPTSLVIVPLIQSSRQCSQACKAIKTIIINQDNSLKCEFIYIIIRNEPCFRNMFH